MGLTEGASCSVLKESVVMYYVPKCHKACPWSQERIKANPFPFSEKQLKAHVLLMMPLSFLCGQQTFTEHSLCTVLGDTKKTELLLEVNIHSKGSRHSNSRNATSLEKYICAFQFHFLLCLTSPPQELVMIQKALVYALAVWHLEINIL